MPYLRLVASAGEPVPESDWRGEPTFPEPRLSAEVDAELMVESTIDEMPAYRPRPVPRHPIRLTRRGRTVLWLFLLAIAVAAVALLAPASQAAARSGPPRTVTVRSGDTMWSIATAALPRESPNTAIERVRMLNHLPDDRVFVGEQLLVPAS